MIGRTPYKGGSPLVFSLFNESARRGWSRKTIAYKAGVGASTVASWWSGERAPGIANIERWAGALGGFVVLSIPVEQKDREVVERSAAARWAWESQRLIGYAGREP